jgi:hypothetical protein
MRPLIALVLLVAISLRPALAAEIKSVEAEETQFKVTLTDGRVLRSAELVGAVLTIAAGSGTMRVRIDAVERDPDARRGGVWLHTLSVQGADGGWGNLCSAGPDGRREAFPLAGKARAGDGMFEIAPPGTFELTCTSGAQGKCVRFGYLPWDGGAEGLARYNACIRMVRADYCGDGTPHTKDGTLIDLFDKIGIQTDDPALGLEFEAAWAPHGAICVRHVRIPEIYSLDRLRAECLRLKPEDIGDGCTEERMAKDPAALLMNKSRVK